MNRFKSILHIFSIAGSTLCVAFVITWALSKVPILNPITDSVLDFEFTDQVFKEKDYSQIPRDTNIFIVNVGNYSRFQIAGMIDSINRYNPKVICMNVMFKDQKQQFVDSILQHSFSNVDNLLFISGVADEHITSSHGNFTKNGINYSGNLVLGLRNRIRDFSTISNYDNKEYEHIGLAASSIYNTELSQRFIRRANSNETINYIGGIDKYPIIDFDHKGLLTVYTTDSLGFLRPHPNIGLEKIEGKIVLFGFVAETAEKYDPFIIDPLDAFFTPLPYVLSWIGSSDIPNTKGVIIHANIISTILNEDYIDSSNLANLIISSLVIILSSALFYFFMNRFPNHYGLITKAIALLLITLLIFLTIIVFKDLSYKYDPRWVILVLLFLSDTSEIYKQYILKTK